MDKKSAEKFAELQSEMARIDEILSTINKDSRKFASLTKKKNKLASKTIELMKKNEIRKIQ